MGNGLGLYADNTPRSGMVFRPCDGDQIRLLLAGMDVLDERAAENGKRTLILRK